MKVLVIIAITLTLMAVIDCRHVKGKHQKHTKKSNIVHSRRASKRQYLAGGGCCTQYGYTNPNSCCQLPNPPTCCQTNSEPQHTIIPASTQSSQSTNCCQTPQSPPCCSRVPYQMSLQGCCGTVQPQPTASPHHTCCVHVGMKGNEQRNISMTSSTGHKFVLNVKLIPDAAENPAGGQICKTPCSSTPSPTSSTSPTSPISPISTTIAASPTVSSLTLCQESSLSEHNAKREIHNAPSMILDKELSTIAQVFAEALMKKKQNIATFEENKGAVWGLNLFHVSGFKPDDVLDCKTVVQKWYKEVENYNFGSPGYSKETKHFTQVVWKKTTHLGIGLETFTDKSKPDGKSYVVVAVYKKAGNIDGKFSENVDKGKYDGEIGFKDCQEKGLAEHNIKRQIHGSPPMTLDPDLNELAQGFANDLSRLWKPSRNIELSQLRGRSNYIVIKRVLLESDTTIGVCKAAVDIWYKEVQNYDFNNPRYSPETGHFTQVVWKSSKKLGMAKAQLEDHSGFVAVAIYEIGNVDEKFAFNVQKGSYVEYSDCQKAALLYHNAKRPLHKSSSISLDQGLNNEAKIFAEKAATFFKLETDSDDFKNQVKPGYSFSLKCEKYNDERELCEKAVDEWYKESNNYDFSTPKYDPLAKHFTQMVWKASTKLGIGLANFTLYEHGIQHNFWNEIHKGDLDRLENDPRYPNNPVETKTQELSTMEVYVRGSNYAQTLTAYFAPKVTGDYEFFETCDDHCWLLVSSDENPDNGKKVLNIPNSKGQEDWQGPSSPIPMVAGKRYYIQAVMGQIGGGQHLRVGVKLPNGDFEKKPIHKSLLLKYPLSVSDTCHVVAAKYQEAGNKEGQFGANVEIASSQNNQQSISIFSKTGNFFKNQYNKFKEALGLKKSVKIGDDLKLDDYLSSA